MLNEYVNKSLKSSTLKWCGSCGYAQNGVVMFKENLIRPIDIVWTLKFQNFS